MARGAHAVQSRRRTGSGTPTSRHDRKARRSGSTARSASPSAVVSRLSVTGTIRSELRKALSLRSTMVLLILNVALLPAGAALTAWALAFVASTDLATGQPAADPGPLPASMMWSSVGGFVTTCMIVTGIFGVMAITTEYSTTAIQSSLTVNPRRMLFMNAKMTATAALTFLSSLIGLLLSWLVAHLMLAGAGLTPLADSEKILPWVTIIGGSLVLTLTAVMALGFGGLCRSTMGGVCSLIGVLMIFPSILSLAGLRFDWLQSVARCLPDQAASKFLTGGVSTGITASTGSISVSGTAGTTAGTTTGVTDATTASAAGSGADTSWIFNPTWWQSGLILLAWAVAIYLIGLLVVRRADIN